MSSGAHHASSVMSISRSSPLADLPTPLEILSFARRGGPPMGSYAGIEPSPEAVDDAY